jgi:Flp pilus assembly pilin Flp
MRNKRSNQRGASLIETALSVALVAVTSIAALSQFGATIRNKIQQELVVSLGGKGASMTAGVPHNDRPPGLTNPVLGVAQPLPLSGGHSPVGGVPNNGPLRVR